MADERWMILTQTVIPTAYRNASRLSSLFEEGAQREATLRRSLRLHCPNCLSLAEQTDLESLA